MITFLRITDYTKDSMDLKGKDMIIMSQEEFVKGGKDIKGVPVCITPTGTEPEEKYITGMV